jgi:hypothetical protein
VHHLLLLELLRRQRRRQQAAQVVRVALRLREGKALVVPRVAEQGVAAARGGRRRGVRSSVKIGIGSHTAQFHSAFRLRRVELINKCDFVIVQKFRLCFYKVVNEMLAMVVSAIKKFQGGNDNENGKFFLEKIWRRGKNKGRL